LLTRASLVETNELMSMSLEDEFAALMSGFEALMGHREELDGFSSLIANFELMAAVETPPLEQFPQERMQDFFDGFEAEWRNYIKENAESASILNIWKIADLGVVGGGGTRCAKAHQEPRA